MFSAGIPGVKFADWLYGSYDEDKYNKFLFLYSTPLKPYMDYLLDQRSSQEYMKHNGLTYSDIHDPRKLSSTSSGAAFYGSTFRLVSRNLDKLYR